MSLIYNGTTVSGLNYNSTACDSLTYNGTVVYQNAPAYQGLTFTANTAGSTITMSAAGSPSLGQNFSYSTDGTTWNTFTVDSTVITLTNAGDKVYFKGNNPNGIGEDYATVYEFLMSGSIAASGNIMSLIDNGACTTTTIPNDYCFNYLFYNCESLTAAPSLPATTLKKYCYRNMFRQCTALTTAPALPATALAQYCYEDMFNGCTSLTTAPALPATALAQYCYMNMFLGCTSLTSAPTLPATTLATGCYEDMFNGCTSLTTAPALPATTLADSCYFNMFINCTHLTTAPELPATTLVSLCYTQMFAGCASLIVRDTSQSGTAEQAWKIPTSGIATGNYTMSSMFANCAGTRSSDSPNFNSTQKTYYTQNTPIS